VNYVWIAAFIMALGGFVAGSDRRYRTARDEALEPGVASDLAAKGKAG